MEGTITEISRCDAEFEGRARSAGVMPVVRYFVFVGSVLFGLLLAADRYLPAPAGRSSAIDVNRSIIRIRSARNLPEKIVFDTASALVVTASGPAEVEQREDPRHALARMPRDSQAVKPAPTPVGRVAERRASRLHPAFRKPAEPRVAMDRHEYSADGSPKQSSIMQACPAPHPEVEPGRRQTASGSRSAGAGRRT
ncbi:hypothetical protein [Bradyrhizobium japonicum]|uniref:hypothetical protein n=1 Tax=Bradyrhizobium japonicum TaxID=375 RepID=UPI0027152F6F|nr:hypothetical protein [Bradyrhizobium japonicum]WLB24319.1 hypothetical protein QIH95_48155 [Bradyrhizobium japonicum]